MEHTYLRYECADSFGLATASASSKAPQSNSTLAFIGGFGSSKSQLSTMTLTLLTTAGSYLLGWNIKTCQPVLRLGHREHLTGGVGTGRALNSDEIVCLDVAVAAEGGDGKVATGWVDGAVRIFDLTQQEMQRPRHGLQHSLLFDNDDEDFVQREPLVLNGHGQSPVRTICFDASNSSRLASGGSDGSVVLWDVVSETGVFRLIGHRGGITDVVFCKLEKVDALITSSLDGLVKVWDLEAQCCTQTIASHRGEVWTATCQNLRLEGDEESDRWRLMTGGNDGQIRVWSVDTPKRLLGQKEDASKDGVGEKNEPEDDVCRFMGSLLKPANHPTSNDRLATIRYHPSNHFVGVLQANSKQVDIYRVRSVAESSKKRQRRLKRRQEKTKKQADGSIKEKDAGKKRGFLDDPVSSADEDESPEQQKSDKSMDPESLKASDEFEWMVSVRSSHKIKGFAFVPGKKRGEVARVVVALSTNALETYKIVRKKDESKAGSVAGTISFEKLASIDMYGHPTGIRAVALSSDDAIACTVSKNSTKIWNVRSRSLVQSLSPSVHSAKNKGGCYGLCAAFLPGNGHVVMGTREGHVLIVNISSGEVVFAEENAHDGAVWSIDVKRPSATDSSLVVVTGSADKSVKFWGVQEGDEDDGGDEPILVHERTLQMSDDVVAVRFSNTLDSAKRLVFVTSLDSTIKVFFDDSLKLFLSLYGHKLPVLAVDATHDDILLASGGADKTVKIWGLDFGDTHRTLHGHQDSITDIRFVKRTHNFFTTSKDGTLRYWDADRFQQILLLNGHSSEVNCLAVNRTGAFVLTGGMDRQIRVWERTQDIVFLEEERERELERIFDNVNHRNEGRTADILDTKEEDGEGDGIDMPQTEAAVKKSIMSVSAGDRIMEALEQADQELKDIAALRKANPQKPRIPNPLMMGLEPAQYVLWVLESIKNAELEQSLLLLPINHVERLMYYLILLLRAGRGIELCSKVGVSIVKIHQNQVVATPSLTTPLRELYRLTRLRLRQARDDIVGYNLAALRLVAQTHAARKQAMRFGPAGDGQDIWAGMGLGSDLAAAAQGRPNKN